MEELKEESYQKGKFTLLISNIGFNMGCDKGLETVESKDLTLLYDKCFKMGEIEVIKMLEAKVIKMGGYEDFKKGEIKGIKIGRMIAEITKIKDFTLLGMKSVDYIPNLEYLTNYKISANLEYNIKYIIDNMEVDDEYIFRKLKIYESIYEN